MTSNRTSRLYGMTTKQKVMLVALVVIVIITLWQLGVFEGKSVPVAATQTVNSLNQTVNQAATRLNIPKPANLPQATTLPKPEAMTAKEIALIKLQQETEAKYIAALNELQMLKVQKDIADMNKDIAAAKLDTVTAQKSTLQLLTTPATPPGGFPAANLMNTPSTPPANPAPPEVPKPIIPDEANYAVVSVSQLQYKWGAVLGYQGRLFNVSVGDVLPDGSSIVSIDKSGVVLRHNGNRRKISLVPII